MYDQQSTTDAVLTTNVTSSILYEVFVYSLTLPLFIITAVGNGVILITLKCQARLLSSSSNYFILSLASADFLVGVAVMPIMSIFTAKHGHWSYSQTLCDTWMAVDFLCSSASFLTLSAMSIERYKMLTTSYMHIKHSSKLRVLILISLSWFLPFSTWIPVIITFRNINGSKSSNTCEFPAGAPIVLSLSIILYHIPLICMVTFYTILITQLKRSSLKHLSSQTLNQVPQQAQVPQPRHMHHHRHHHPSHDSNYIYNQLNTNRGKLYLNDSPPSETCGLNDLVNNEQRFNKKNSVKSRFSMNTYSRQQNYVLNNLCCCLTSIRARRLSTFRSNSSSSNTAAATAVNNNNNNIVVNINFRKCILSVPDNTSISSYYPPNGNNQDGTVDQNQNQNNYELNMFRDPPIATALGTVRRSRSNSTALNLNVKRGSVANHNRLLKRRYSSFSIKTNSMFSRKSKSLFYPTAAGEQQNLEQQHYDDSLNYQNLRIKRNRKAARMLGILVAAFTICWSPFTVIYPLSLFYKDLIPESIQTIAWWLGYANSAINPFLYVYSNKTIRRSVRNLFYTRLSYLFCRNKNQRNDSLTRNTSTKRIIGRHNNNNNNNNHY